MPKLGLLGERLSHSYSPEIHAMLHDCEYNLFEIAPQNLAQFLKNGDFDGVNVTIPYKKDVIPFCATLSDEAKRIGSVNTLVRRGGLLHGFNTDYFGFGRMLRMGEIVPRGKKILVLGTGGASLTVQAALRDMGASEIVVISRTGENNYENLHLHKNARIIINTTPVGMYPKNGATPLRLQDFPECEAVADLVYNPARTALLLSAQELGIKNVGGLPMLAAQAFQSAEIFLDKEFLDGRLYELTEKLSKSRENIILIGMPGCGKTRIGKELAALLSREFFDADTEIEAAQGMSIPQIFEAFGEEHFRTLETEMLKTLGKKSGAVISTGGGCVTRAENYESLHQNGKIVWIKRSTSALETEGRPLSSKASLEEMFETRRHSYAKFSDVEIENNSKVSECCAALREIFE